MEAFLSHLATARGVSASTQNQALAALLFLYGPVLGAPLPRLADVTRAKRPRGLPTVLARAEVQAVLAALGRLSVSGWPPYGLVGTVLYGAGLRLLEARQLELTPRNGRGV
ncbi:hypothetical protein tb265_32970 [Gemmatimonadetes bacterium T265]|nr:hypothetical protein tb265_32970 [Gemmatimonadetes bacterium T265]